jgi:hypothetical protein
MSAPTLTSIKTLKRQSIVTVCCIVLIPNAFKSNKMKKEEAGNNHREVSKVVMGKDQIIDARPLLEGVVEIAMKLAYRRRLFFESVATVSLVCVVLVRGLVGGLRGETS